VIERVEALLREVAAKVVIPRFGHLSPGDIERKAPGDLVTVADREAERELTTGLLRLLPGSTVVGEEAVAADSALMGRLRQPGDVWLVDPVDGTANYAAGRTPFAMMVALVRSGQTVLACILDPVTDRAATAELGSGAYLGGERVIAPRTPRMAADLRGVCAGRYFPNDVRSEIAGARRTVGEVLPGHMCAGYEYPAIARDEQQFAFFWRMLPWDHAPGILFVEEAGGVAWHLDGTPYDPSAPGFGVLVAQNPDIWQTVRSTLLADVKAPTAA
jgi:fructose-1,6-bisphosphatase/inositol monophosphatase family enzyme